MKNISLSINHIPFDINIENEFYDDLVKILELNNISISENNSISNLLSAYIETSLLKIENDKIIDRMICNIQEAKK